MTCGCVLVSRNDDYGENQVERTLYSVNSALRSYDEVIYVDWASEDRTLVDEIKDDLIDQSKFKYVIISPEKASSWVGCYPNAQKCVEVLGRNIGLRRLSTDFLISTNPDVIQPPRQYLERFTSIDSFVPAGKRTISLFDIRDLGNVKDDIATILLDFLDKYGQQPVVGVCEGDEWSLVSGCGDFQIAHRSIWYIIRGFEETLIGPGYADSNVQKKALLSGYKIGVDWDIPVWHIGHARGGGGSGTWNDVNSSLRDFIQTTNLETWGFSNDPDLELRTL